MIEQLARTNERYTLLIEEFRQIALCRPAINAALIIGSRARHDHPADEWSDLDLLVFVHDPEAFAQQTDWFDTLAEVWLSFLTHTPGGDPERRVLYAGGLDVDFAIMSVAALQYMAENDLPPQAGDLLRRGTRILVDKDGLLRVVQRKPLPTDGRFRQPDQATFSNLVHDFWFHTLWSAKHLRRGELWWAKMCSDMHLKNLLSEMLKWHACAQHGAHYDTWMGVRFLEEWADPRAVAEFGEIFAHYDRDDIARALLATMHLFRWLAVETAQRWHYPYPEISEMATSVLVEQLLA